MIDLIPYEVIGVLSHDFWLRFQADLLLPWPDQALRFVRSRIGQRRRPDPEALISSL